METLIYSELPYDLAGFHMHTYRLKGASGKVARQAFGLAERTLVGSSAECDLVIDDETIAPRHAEILVNPEGVMELVSLVGGFVTHLNGAPVTRARLCSGDEIRLGNCRWVLQAPGLRPDKVLSAAALKQRRNHLPWLLLGAVLAAAALAWQRGWIVV